MTDLERKILGILCRHSLDWCMGWVPYPSTTISKQLDVSLYKVRKALKVLKEMGYIESHSRCYMGEDHNVIMNGYLVTDKVIGTPEYEQAKVEEEKFIETLFNH